MLLSNLAIGSSPKFDALLFPLRLYFRCCSTRTNYFLGLWPQYKPHSFISRNYTQKYIPWNYEYIKYEIFKFVMFRFPENENKTSKYTPSVKQYLQHFLTSLQGIITNYRNTLEMLLESKHRWFDNSKHKAAIYNIIVTI